MKIHAVLLVLAAAFIQPATARDKPAEPLPGNVSLSLPEEEAASVYGQLQEPIPGAQITSGFGWRRHPVLRRMRFHAGFDYGASIGTQVLAAGGGVIEKVARAKDRGLYVVIRHSDHLASAYSHLSAVEPGLTVGASVSAQQAIALTGRSGRASGPHLDFEVFLDGMRVDPAYTLAVNHSPAGNYVDSKRVGFNDL